MNRSLEQLLIWAPLGVGVGLMLSDHKHLGWAVTAVTPITVAVTHPRGTRKTLRAIPRGLHKAGRAIGRAGEQMARSSARGARETGRGFRWLAS
ncbi:MAG: hypothetical protein ACRD2D_06465 [Terriglobales bacterium]